MYRSFDVGIVVRTVYYWREIDESTQVLSQAVHYRSKVLRQYSMLITA
ncbi:MAG TPA: hypothetical protein H9889_09360 [Candidatus Ignatzschineria merdigallinarum]|uniref:Uncharacterized protein n=1 Tax=Candidatus Ignatzschineria merdigallinarum TaxID=2838621 RepID=A0A9D1Q7T9_9GAMM|nr:hypothetical protein [Candidatus Ignatzschineria merdigallinarum]